MNRSWLILAAVAVVAVAAGGAYLAMRGSTIPAGIWLQVDQDPASTQVNLAVFAACDGNEDIETVTVDETAEAVVVEMWLNLPGGVQPESCAGMPFNLDLQEPLGARTVLQRNPDGSTTPVQPNPY